MSVSAVRDDQISEWSGVSMDSPTMWQIGINIEPDSRRSAWY